MNAELTLMRRRALRRAEETARLLEMMAPTPIKREPTQQPFTEAAAVQPGLFEDMPTRQAEHQQPKPQPMEMFSQRALAQFGVKANPLMPLTVDTALTLSREDPRSEAEKELDRTREAEALTMPLSEDFENSEEHRRDYAAWAATLPACEE